MLRSLLLVIYLVLGSAYARAADHAGETCPAERAAVDAAQQNEWDIPKDASRDEIIKRSDDVQAAIRILKKCVRSLAVNQGHGT